MWCTSPGRGGWRCRAPSSTRQGERQWRPLQPRVICRRWPSRTNGRRSLTSSSPTMQELVDLSLIGKQLHWAVVGHAFRPVHEQLDELVASWRDLADVVAERAVALGYVPDGQARAVAAGSPLSPVAAEATEFHAVVRAITDPVSQDVLIDVVRALEHQQWMLRAQLSDRA